MNNACIQTKYIDTNETNAYILYKYVNKNDI